MKYSCNISRGVKAGLIVVLLWSLAGHGYAQETVFTFLKSDIQKAKQLFDAGNYAQALTVYLSIKEKTQSNSYDLPIARANYYMHDVAEAGHWYSDYVLRGDVLPDKDIYLYAECLAASGKYEDALKYYTLYQKANSDDEVAIKKIWQLKNREYLFEDSTQFAVRPLLGNSAGADICPVPFEKGYVFLSNRKRQSVVEKLDGKNQPFFRLYNIAAITDSVGTTLGYKEPEASFHWLNTRYQLGPVSFYNDQKSMAFISSGRSSVNDKSKRSLQLFFADRLERQWTTREPFAFNSTESSISAVAVQEDGKALYLSSNMPGGHGGLDLYVSKLVNGQWTKPQNLGEKINSSGDESYPSVWGNTLYFASNGLAGLGGLDIFSVHMEGNVLAEPVNMGYPVNTHYDDFSLSLNAEGSKGLFSSNRLNGNDDVYELTLHMQSYPYTITGVLKIKEESWSDVGELKIMPNAQLSLIDNQKNAVVVRANSDANGLFNLTIPYFSQYRIKITSVNDEDETVVSLDLAKTRNQENKYEVVVVKNSFRKTD